MTSYEIHLKDFINKNSSRGVSRDVREKIFFLLESYNSVILNVVEANLTPSAADEIFGKLAKQLGAKKFKDKILIKNYTPSQLLLIKHVISRRVSEQ